MSALIKLFLFSLAAFLLPFLTGLLPVSLLPCEKRRIPLVVLSGYLATFALFELVGLPILIWTATGDFKLLVRLFLILDLIWILAGCVRCGRTGGLRLPYLADSLLAKFHSGPSFRSSLPTDRASSITSESTTDSAKSAPFGHGIAPDSDTVFWWIIFLLLLGFQLYMSYTRASFDGDDAYYVAQTLQTWQTDTMYYYVPYTGVSTSLDGRHAMALMPMWIAFVARICGTHSTIVTHSMMPLILIPVVDIVLYQLASELTRDLPRQSQQRRLPAIMIVCAVLQIFGNSSIYTPETFLIMRTWQGKTMFACLLLPALFVLLLRVLRFDRSEARWCWLTLVLLNLAAGFCTSLAPALISGLFLLAAFLIRILKRQKGFLLAALAACIPSILYTLLLLRMIFPSLLPFLKGGRLP